MGYQELEQLNISAKNIFQNIIFHLRQYHSFLVIYKGLSLQFQGCNCKP